MTVAIASEARGESGGQARLQLEVRTQTGEPIYRGSIVTGAVFNFDYPLPADTTSLEFVTIDDGGAQTSRVVPIDPDHPGVSVMLGGAP